MAKAKSNGKSGLLSRIKSSNTLDHMFYMGDDENPYEIRDWFDTGNILFNCLLSADPYKGAPSGRTIQFVGPASVGKTYLCLELLKSTQSKEYIDALYDSEFANSEKQDMIKRGLNPDLLVWKGVDEVEALTTDLLNLMGSMEDGDKLAIMIDSIGNLSTRKEVKDSSAGSDKKDMTRAAQLKALFRTCTLKAGVLQIPIFLVNHCYASVGSFIPTNIPGGGSGSIYNSSIIVDLTKAQDKGTDGTIGAIISATSIKNRLAKEKKKVKFTINFNQGLLRYSGLVEYGVAKKIFINCAADGKPKPKKEAKAGAAAPKQVITHFLNTFTGEIIATKSMTDEKWEEVLSSGLADFLRKDFAYQSSAGDILETDDDNVDMDINIEDGEDE